MSSHSRTSDDHWLARLFLLALAAAGIYGAWTHTPPESLAVVPCPFFQTTGIPCPGCGMSRACLNLARGDIASAWHYHPFSIGIVGLAIVASIMPHRLRSTWERISQPSRHAILAVLMALLLGLWVYRLGR